MHKFKFTTCTLQEADDRKPRHKSASEMESGKSSSKHEASKHRSSSSGSAPKPNSGSASKSEKRPSSCDINESASKKPRLNGDGHSSGKSSSKSLLGSDKHSYERKSSKGFSENDLDSEHLKDVAAKLDLLKSMGKNLKTPTKSFSSEIFKGDIISTARLH